MKNKKTAFTLIELLVVMVIIGILATVSVATFGSNKEKADAARSTANCVQKAKCERAKAICEENGGTNCDSFCEGDNLDCDVQNIAELAAEVHGYFPLSGSVSDVSTNNWSASGSSNTWVPNRFGTANAAKNFSPNNSDRFDINSSIQPQNGEVTVCAWVNPDDVDRGPGGVSMAIGDYDGSSSGDDTVLFGFSNGGYLFHTWDSNSANASSSVYGAASTGSWAFFCGVKDATQSSVYINGTQLSSKIAQDPLRNNASDQWRIGSARNNSREYDGQMSDVFIFDKAFSAEEIFGLYSITNNETTYNQFLAEFD